MPTPMHVWREIAARYGGFDPSDQEAVDRWYEEELPKLSADQHQAILDELLDRECEDEPDGAAHPGPDGTG